MDDDEIYEYDSVSNTVLVTQKALDYLGYEVERSDGYFDRSLADALRTYKADRGLPEDEILDQQTFNSIVSETRRELSNNREKDTQFQKALEIIEN